MAGAEERLLRWIDQRQDELAQALAELVRIPSVVGAEGACQARVAEMMAPWVDEVDVWEPDARWLEGHPAYFAPGTSFAGRPNVVGTVKGVGRRKSLLLNAHVDVVQAGPAQGWTRDPWDGAVEAGQLYGRGAIDDKAGLACMLFVARGLRELKVRLGGDLILESVVDEEWGGGGTLATLQRGYRADAGIMFEATAMEICVAARGGQAFKVTVTGRGAHPIRAYEGVSALEKALPLLQALKDLERQRQERWRTPAFANFPIFLPIVIGKITADEFPSKVPERCVFEGLYGYSPAESYQDARRELEACIAAAAATDPWLREYPPVVQWHGLNKEGAQISADHPIVRTLGGALSAGAGTSPVISAFIAGCDLPYLVKYAGIPCVVWGPGDPRLAHTSQERVNLSELTQTAKVLALTVLRWCEGL